MMRLLWSSRSPFARKVMVAVHELGLADQITPERVVVSATTAEATVMAANPLGQIPTLILEDGTTLFDSAVIIEVLNDRHGGALLPPQGPERRAALCTQALADGLMALNVLRLGERARGPLESPQHQAAFVTKTNATLDALEHLAPIPWTIGGIATACVLSHLDFRFPADAWRTGRPALAAWHADMARRPSMQATEFQDAY